MRRKRIHEGRVRDRIEPTIYRRKRRDDIIYDGRNHVRRRVITANDILRNIIGKRPNRVNRIHMCVKE